MEINPKSSQAHYYRGRSRYRLGYIESAIEAYTQAISCESDFAQAYYHRALAHRELQENSQTVKDLQTAAELFQRQGDLSGYRLAMGTLTNLDRKQPLTIFLYYY